MMSGEKLNALAEVGALSLEDGPPEYSSAIGSDSKLSIYRAGLDENKGFEKTATLSCHQALSKYYSKCTRCDTYIGATEHHFACPKCNDDIHCVCQKCRDNIPRCRIHHIDLIKRTLKAWPAASLYIDYISPTPTKHDNPLIHALKTHDDSLIALYARDSSLLNARTYLGYTPLHFAANLGLVSSASILLSHGALTNARDDNNMTPLLLAIDADKPQIVDLLLQNNVNIHSVGGFRETTALHAAAANGFPTLVSLLLEKGAMIDTPSGRGTALQLASRVDSFECASILLENGSNPNARSEVRLGEPPIISAVRNGNAELVDLLIKYGANVDLTYVGKNPLEEFTALYIAVSLDSQDMARRLLGCGADVNWHSKRDISYLMRAAALGLVKMCEILIEGGVEIDWENDIGMNAVVMAAILGKEETLDFLLEEGANGKPPKVCRGKWKTVEKFRKRPMSKEMKSRILKKLRAAKHK